MSFLFLLPPSSSSFWMPVCKTFQIIPYGQSDPWALYRAGVERAVRCRGMNCSRGRYSCSTSSKDQQYDIKQVTFSLSRQVPQALHSGVSAKPSKAALHPPGYLETMQCPTLTSFRMLLFISYVWLFSTRE